MSSGRIVENGGILSDKCGNCRLLIHAEFIILQPSLHSVSQNGHLIPVAQAQVSVANIEYAYGFGVYETLRVVGGRPRFLAEHLARLAKSAQLIGLEHALTLEQLENWITQLLQAETIDVCNVKILLIGGRTAADAQLYILPLAPLFPDRKLYRDGVATITQHFERPWPQAKTLSMLGSYLAYRQARLAQCYDALLINRQGAITEGTRTNFLALQGRTVVSPPFSEVLDGVVRRHVLTVAAEAGFTYREEPIMANVLEQYDGFFLTSTSTKIMPISRIDDRTMAIPAALTELMAAFADYLAQQEGR
jgi:branched-chain amino acid aminotransferase